MTSTPPLLNGLHLNKRQMLNPSPFKSPFFSMAMMEYAEHEG